MKKKHIVLILFIGLVFIGASCGREEEAKKELSTSKIIRQDAFIRDEIRVNIDEDDEKERVVLYVLDKEVEKDTDIWCGNVSGEQMAGKFYLALIDNDKIKSRIELLMSYLENGNDYAEKKIILAQDLNGDNEKLEFVFSTYGSCNGNYIEIISWDFEEEELVRYKFYNKGEVSEELFISPMIGNGLEYKDNFLIQEYYSNVEPSGIFHNYYSFSKDRGGYNFEKTIKITD